MINTLCKLEDYTCSIVEYVAFTLLDIILILILVIILMLIIALLGAVVDGIESGTRKPRTKRKK